ncbi:hypothetical protein IJMDGFEA_00182 [Klebsiella phage KP5]|nr:hypothetical protein OOGAAMIP_00213 [Klebsiella phage Kp11_Ajakkala-2023]
MKLYHVVYSGVLGIDKQMLVDVMCKKLDERIGTRYKNHVSESIFINVDHPNDMEEMVNTLDDQQIPFVDNFNMSAGVYTVVTFVLKNVDSRNDSVLNVVAKIDSTKGK